MERTAEESPGGGQPKGPSWLGRMIVAVFAIWIGGFGILAYRQALLPIENPTKVLSPFKFWEGDWEGEFTSRTISGEVIEHLKVRRSYKHLVTSKDFRQEGHFIVTDAASGVERDESDMRQSDFQMQFLRRRAIADGGRAVGNYEGRIENGGLVWRRRDAEVVESLREWIEEDTAHVDGAAIYEIEGAPVGILYEGTFRRVRTP